MTSEGRNQLHSYKKTLIYALQGSLMNLLVPQGKLQRNYVLIFGEKKIMLLVSLSRKEFFSKLGIYSAG